MVNCDYTHRREVSTAVLFHSVSLPCRSPRTFGRNPPDFLNGERSPSPLQDILEETKDSPNSFWILHYVIVRPVKDNVLLENPLLYNGVIKKRKE